MAQSIADMARVNATAALRFQSESLPEKMGNSADIAYGGCVLSMAISAAHQTVPPAFKLYSVLGYYLGPTLTSDKATLTVEDIRSTKTFCTRKVVASQEHKGVARSTFYIIADFQVVEPALLTYNVTHRMPWPLPDRLLTIHAHVEGMVRSKKIHPNLAKAYLTAFGLFNKFFEHRVCPESTAAQNLSGVNKRAVTTQDHLPLVSKTSAMWFKAKQELTNPHDHYAALGFVMDAGLAFLPLAFSHMFLDDAGPTSSLDLSLHFHTSQFRADEWLLHEQHTEAGAEGRTYSVGRVFALDGRLIATMAQMGICRPKPPSKSKL